MKFKRLDVEVYVGDDSPVEGCYVAKVVQESAEGPVYGDNLLDGTFIHHPHLDAAKAVVQEKLSGIADSLCWV